MTAVGLVATGVVLGGTTLAVRDSTSTIAGDPPNDDRAADTINQVLDGASVPANFDPAPLQPLATLFVEDRAAAVTGVAQAVACAWVSRYAADEDGPAGHEAVEVLAAA